MSGVKHNYIEEVLAQVKFKYDHADIRQELTEHIEDLLDFAPPMEEAEVEVYVREQMGDPVAVGQALDREHHVVLGWLWMGTRICLILFILFLGTPLVFNTALLAYDTVSTVVQGYGDVYGEPIAKIDVDETLQLDDMTLWVDELVKYENDSIEIRYRYVINPFGKSNGWGFHLHRCISFDNGQSFFSGGGFGSGGWIHYNQYHLDDVGSDATKMILDYDQYGRQFHVEIPLEWEVIE